MAFTPPVYATLTNAYAQAEGFSPLTPQGDPDNPCLVAGYQQIDSLTAAAGLSLPGAAIAATIVPEGAAVRWRSDGTDPTATVGMPLAIGETLILRGIAMAEAKFIQQAGTAKLNVTYWK